VPIIYLYPFLILSLSQNNLQLILAFIAGLLLDIFLQTGGVFATVTVFIVYIKRILITPLLNNRKNDENIKPLEFSFNQKIYYYGIAVLFTIILINLLESMSISYVFYKMPLFIINTILSLILIIFIDYLFIHNTDE
jgi:hypothetical protein